jgi:hypothetical protein
MAGDELTPLAVLMKRLLERLSEDAGAVETSSPGDEPPGPG